MAGGVLPPIDIAPVPVDQRIKQIFEALRNSDQSYTSQPGTSDLLSALGGYIDPTDKLDKVDFLRGVLRVYRQSSIDNAYQDFVKAKLTLDEASRLESFVDGSEAAEAGDGFVSPHSFGVRDELAVLHTANKAIIAQTTPHFEMRTANGHSHAEVELKSSAPQHGFRGFVHRLAAFLSDNDDRTEVKIWDDIEFRNWGQTVAFTPKYTLWPRTVSGTIHIVKFAIRENLTIRCAGYRHSWSPIFGESGQILVSMLDPDKVSHLPDTTSLPLWEATEPTELESIEIVRASKLSAKPGKTLVRVGAACTNERLRRWCIDNGKVTIPLNSIIVETTLGGSNASICHGSGRQSRTLSDLVRSIEYVDCHGILHTVSDPHQLRAASGAFGILGIVTHLTLEFDPMSYAQLSPKKLPVAIAVPPPDGYEARIPPALRVARTPSERQADIKAFEQACENDYYAEWFWFPYSDEAWVNTWSNTTDGSGVVEFPSATLIFLQWTGTVLMNIAQYSKVLDTIGDDIGLDFTGPTIISRAAMWMLGEESVKTYLTDGLHFQRAIQNVRVRDLEVEIAIPSVSLNEPVSDWTVARRAWWDAILIAYEHAGSQPQSMPLEMRIMGDSDVILAPQRGNKMGTCSIEVLTLESKRDQWMAYSQQVLDKWTSYTDSEGNALKTRPHWAKEWYGHTVGGRQWSDVVNEQYASEVKEFAAMLEEMGQQQGWKLAELRERFGNPWLNVFIFGGEK